MSSTPLRRLFVLLLAALPVLTVASPASAETVPSCPPGSEVVNTFGVRVAVSGQSGWLFLCFDDVTLGGLVVGVGTNASTPLVPLDVSRTPGTCPVVVTTSPVELSVSASTESLCIGLNGLTTTVTYGPLGYQPAVQVWRTGTGRWIDQAFCIREQIAWNLYEPAYDEWVECAYQPHRIV